MASFSTRAFVLLSLLAPFMSTVHGFRINFWLGERCSSAEISTRKENYTPHGKCYIIPVNAQSATVNKQSVDRARDVVAFYQGKHCGHRLASTNGGCVDFTGTGHNAGSFRIFRHGNTKRNDDADAVELHEASSSVAAADDPDPYGQFAAGFGHGNVTDLWGETYKWWQAAPGVHFGIPLDEWDDDIHTINAQSLQMNDEPEDLSTAISLPEGRSLDKRLNIDYCVRTLKTCARETNAAAFVVADYWGRAAHKAAKAVPIAHKFYDWTHKHPFSVGFVTAAGTGLAGFGLGQTSGGATAQDNDQLQQCSTAGAPKKEVDGLIESVVNAGTSQDASCSVDITLKDGNILQVHAAVYKKGHVPAHIPCKA
ncbi:uncharacterized protein LTR77_002523 [Saxophila tyrrhenica]|uniref:Uncharacterized protein n=1 Tax=Saxophila tyrrhenica TaxID=1690608 RepID=A0AAV9PIS6_9PEZI|nr:hypothetical protein LTR77_002523 [Saxophila tyrrhenica]